MNWVLEECETRDALTQAALFFLANYAREDWCTRAGLKRLSKVSRQPRSTLQKKLALLEDDGFIVTFARYDETRSDRQTTNLYRLNPMKVLDEETEGRLALLRPIRGEGLAARRGGLGARSPGASERGGQGPTSEAPLDGSNGQSPMNGKTPTEKVDTEGSRLFEIWVRTVAEPIGRRARLTAARSKKLRAVWLEVLKNRNDPEEHFERMCLAAMGSEHHRSKWEFMLPESLFRNEDRRDSWSSKAEDVGDHASRKLTRSKRRREKYDG